MLATALLELSERARDVFVLVRLEGMKQSARSADVGCVREHYREGTGESTGSSCSMRPPKGWKMTFQDQSEPLPRPADCEERAALAFIRRHTGVWSEADEGDLEESSSPLTRLYASAFEEAERAWTDAGKHAESAELMLFREQALARARRSNSQSLVSSRRAPGGAELTSERLVWLRVCSPRSA